MTRPDISFAVGLVSRFSEKHDQTHWNAVRRIISFLNGTQHFVICYSGSTIEPVLFAYSDAHPSGMPWHQKVNNWKRISSIWRTDSVAESSTKVRLQIHYCFRVHSSQWDSLRCCLHGFAVFSPISFQDGANLHSIFSATTRRQCNWRLISTSCRAPKWSTFIITKLGSNRRKKRSPWNTWSQQISWRVS